MMQTTLLYGSAVAIIGILVMFGKNNQKSGWKKTRGSFTDAFQELYADLGLSQGLEQTSGQEIQRQAAAFSPAQPADFSSQLVQLRGALGTSKPFARPSTAPARAAAMAEELEAVPVRAR